VHNRHTDGRAQTGRAIANEAVNVGLGAGIDFGPDHSFSKPNRRDPMPTGGASGVGLDQRAAQEVINALATAWGRPGRQRGCAYPRGPEPSDPVGGAGAKSRRRQNLLFA
jgi:hypothetical protein